MKLGGEWGLFAQTAGRPVVLTTLYVSRHDGDPAGYEVLACGEGTPRVIVPLTPEHPDARLLASAPDLLAVALAYEEWEADLILNGDWSGDFVRMKAGQHDRMLEIQAMRNAAVRKATGRMS